MIRIRHGLAAGFIAAAISGSFLLSPVPAMAYAPSEKHTAATVFQKQFSSSSLLFTENKGQVADINGNVQPGIRYTAHTGNIDLYLSANSISYQFNKQHNATQDPTGKKTTETYNLTVSLEGANPNATITASEQAITKFNYYLPQCPAGITNVASYHKLVYAEVYPHIDWVIYSRDNQLKYDFIVKPGGDPASIRLRINDAESVQISEKGALLMHTRLGDLREKAPQSFADDQPVKSSFRKNADGTIGFTVAQQPGKTLRIDPAVVWSTYFGGSGTDLSNGCTSDGHGHVYLTGYTASAGLASGGYQNTIGGSNDAYLARFDSSGYLLWATYYGNTGDDQGYACVTDASGYVYMGGKTSSTAGIATTGAAQTSNGGGVDAFLVKFDSTGSRIWATYYGGTGTDQTTSAQSVAVDGNNNVYLSGNTASATNIAAGTGFQATIGSAGATDAFLVKFNAAGTRLWGTYYGGTGAEAGYACAADAAGNVYLTGQTGSATGIATTGAYQTTASGGTDTYIAKFDANGGRLWGTYLGHSSGGTTAFGCAVDGSSNIYVTGTTTATTNIATTGSFQTTLGGLGDAFIAKFNAAGTTKLWSTYYGGTGTEQARGCSIDASGNIYICGLSGSATVVGSGGFQSTIGGGNDAFIAAFSNTGSRIWGSYFGGSAAEVAYYCVPDGNGNVYMSGQTASAAGIAQKGTYQQTYGGGSVDAFLVKIGDIGLFTDSVNTTLCTGNPVSVPYSLFGTYNSGNSFTAQLSDASGSFANPVNIGAVSATTAGTISATIPAGTTPGNNYRIRVISSNPVIIGTNNGNNISIGLTTNPTVTLSVSPNDTICLGTPVTFTANAGSSGFNYTWYKGSNPTPINTTDTFYNATTVSNKDTFIVKISNNGCAVPDYDSIIMTVTAPVNPTMTVTVSPNDTICSNTAITLTATATNAGTSQPTWYKNNNATPLATGFTYMPAAGSVSNNDIFKAVLTSNGYCVTSAQVKDSIKITVNPVLTPAVSMAVSPNDTICAGTAISFTTTTVNGGNNPGPSYQWYKNNTSIPGATQSNYTPAAAAANNDVYKIITTINDISGCFSNGTVTDSIRMTVNPSVTPTISIQASPNDTVCAGTQVTCTATVTGNGTGTINWFAGNTNIGTGNSYTFTPTATTWIKAVVNSNAPCAVPAMVMDSIRIVVNPVVTPVVTIAANPGNTICSGQQVSFTATPASGGTYQWFKNNTMINGATNSTYSTTAAANNDIFYVILTSTQPCSTVPADTSNFIVMTVNPNVQPAVTISSSAGNTICSSTLATFTANPTNGGANPGYQWYNGSTAIPGATNAGYTPAGITNGNVFSVVMTSTQTCASPANATSNSITMTVLQQVSPSVTITANPSDTACIGKPVTYTVTAIANYNTGDTLTWKKGTVTVSTGTTTSAAVYTDNAPDGSPVSVTLHSTLPCTNAAYVTSNIISVPVKVCCDAPQNLTIIGLGVNGGIFSWNAVPGVVGYEYNATSSPTEPVTGQLTGSTSCTINTLNPGTYFLYVRAYCGNGVYSPWVKLQFTTPATGIHSISGNDQTLMVYPNPVTDMVTIAFTEKPTAPVTIQLKDISGKTIRTMVSAEKHASMDMHDLATGMYLLYINDGPYQSAVKINKL